MQIFISEYDDNFNNIQKVSLNNYKLILSNDGIKIFPKNENNYSEFKIGLKTKHIIIENDT